MRIFISSVIEGMEEFRDVAAAAARILGYTPIVAEDFGASPEAPQVVCLDGVRQADALVLLLGRRYGYIQSSGLSATHEEYREARDRCPVLVFIKQDEDLEPEQQEFVHEVQAWISGQYTASFVSPGELQDSVVKALHDLELSRARGYVDSDEMLERVLAGVRLFAGDNLHRSYGTGPEIVLSLVGAPRQIILRPAEFESDETRNMVLSSVVIGQDSLFTVSERTNISYDGDCMKLSQPGRELRLTEEGSLTFIGQLPRSEGHIPAVIEEDVREMIEKCLRFGTEILSHVDASNRLSHCSVAVAVRNAQYHPWRTREEHSRSPNSGSMPYHLKLELVNLSPPEFSRAAMRLTSRQIAHDLMVKLRRQFNSGLNG